MTHKDFGVSQKHVLTSVSVSTQQRSQSSERNIPSPVTHEVNIEVVTPTAGYSSVIKRLI